MIRQTLEEARKISFVYEYREYTLAIYAGGGSRNDDDMYWAYIVFSKDGERLRFNKIPVVCLDCEDASRYAESMCDLYLKEIDYEEIACWRDICEYLDNHWGNNICPPDRLNKALKEKHGAQLTALISYDRTRRSLLWDKYKLQLIRWDNSRKHFEGWVLKGNWEFKIDFLEQVYILGRDPEQLPKIWLDKWESKQRKQEERRIIYQITGLLDIINAQLGTIERLQPVATNEDYYKWALYVIGHRSAEARELLTQWHEQKERSRFKVRSLFLSSLTF